MSCFLGVPVLANISAPFFGCSICSHSFYMLGHFQYMHLFQCLQLFDLGVEMRLIQRSAGTSQPRAPCSSGIQNGWWYFECNLGHTTQHLHFTEDHTEHPHKLIGETLWNYAKYWPNLAHFNSLHEDQKDLVQKHQIRGSKPPTDYLKTEKHILLSTHLKIYKILRNIKKKKKKS